MLTKVVCGLYTLKSYKGDTTLIVLFYNEIIHAA